MTTATVAEPGHLSVEAKSKAGEIRVEGTADVWDKLFLWWERCYRFTLEWVAANPILFGLMVFAFTVWRWQAHLTKVELARQKAEYEQARQNARPPAPQKGRARK
ncbi:hypothetical protein [Brevundimonas sp. LjRoot202]|uniref:hypothetical protein n=1 Tax=Brevundimonas sp. LjRoot202 TaxID=3342281 RepID=UPI003ECC8A75